MSTAQAKPPQISIVYSNDVRGETEPCGWKSRQLGGLSKKAYQLQTERKNDPTLLTIDGGVMLVSWLWIILYTFESSPKKYRAWSVLAKV